MRNYAFLFLLVCSTADHAQLGDHVASESKLIALENLWNLAAEHGDLKALSTILDDAFVYVDRNGRLLTKAEVLVDVKATHGIQVSSEAVYVRLHGDTAIVTGIYRIEIMDHGRRIERRDRFLDTWRFKDGAWMAIASLATPIGR